MKDIKVANVQPVAEPKASQKAGRKEKATGASFDDALNDSLQSTVAKLNDLHSQIQTESGGKTPPADSAAIKEEISAAKESFDQMMLQRRNLFQLYQRIANKEEA